MKTIEEKAKSATDALNRAALTMTLQMQSGAIDKRSADIIIDVAQRKAQACHNAYFSRRADRSQIEAVRLAGSVADLMAVRDKFAAVLKNYAKMLGAE